MARTVVISRNTAWSLYNYHAGLIKAMVDAGYDVVAVAPGDDFTERLESCGCRFVDLPMDNHGTHPGRDLLLLMRYLQLFRRVRPLVYLGYTIKPNIYGSLASYALGIPVVNNKSGLGVTFAKNGFLKSMVRGLYKGGLYRSRRIFFQNADNRNLFVRTGLARVEVTDLLPGSGINLAKYPPTPLPASVGRPFRFVLIARMIRHKGIVEFVDAARTVQKQFPGTEFRLVGCLNPSDPNAIMPDELNTWQEEGIIRYCGQTDDVRPHLTAADCVVLPSSYPEGGPRSLLEAAAMGRPIITTDTPGCRDIVAHEVNGYHCRAKDAADLAEKMLRMITLSRDERQKMGLAGRRKADSEFAEAIVTRKYLDIISQLGGATARAEGNEKAA